MSKCILHLIGSKAWNLNHISGAGWTHDFLNFPKLWSCSCPLLARGFLVRKIPAPETSEIVDGLSETLYKSALGIPHSSCLRVPHYSLINEATVCSMIHLNSSHGSQEQESQIKARVTTPTTRSLKLPWSGQFMYELSHYSQHSNPVLVKNFPRCLRVFREYVQRKGIWELPISLRQSTWYLFYLDRLLQYFLRHSSQKPPRVKLERMALV